MCRGGSLSLRIDSEMLNECSVCTSKINTTLNSNNIKTDGLVNIVKYICGKVEVTSNKSVVF